MRWRTGLGAGGGVAIGAAALFSMSTVCGCEPAEIGLARQLGVEADSYRAVQEMTADALEQAAVRKFRGTALTSLVAPTAGREGECRKIDATRLECRYWFEAGWLRKRGRLVSFVADESGRISRVEVSKLTHWNIDWLNAS